jgi:hypothetical protein
MHLEMGDLSSWDWFHKPFPALQRGGRWTNTLATRTHDPEQSSAPKPPWYCIHWLHHCPPAGLCSFGIFWWKPSGSRELCQVLEWAVDRVATGRDGPIHMLSVWCNFPAGLKVSQQILFVSWEGSLSHWRFLSWFFLSHSSLGLGVGFTSCQGAFVPCHLTACLSSPLKRKGWVSWPCFWTFLKGFQCPAGFQFPAGSSCFSVTCATWHDMSVRTSPQGALGDTAAQQPLWSPQGSLEWGSEGWWS